MAFKINKKTLSLLNFVLAGLILLMPVITVAQSGIPAPKNGGSCGTTDKERIKQIQRIVVTPEDGICGPKTIEAIQIWQELWGLEPDGIVGPKTLEKMGLSPESTSTSGGRIKCEAGTTYLNGLCVPDSPFGKDSLAGSSNVTELIMRILKYLLYFSGSIAVVALVIGGFMFISSAGNEEQAEKGRKVMINAVIGVVVIILSFAIVTIVTNLITSGNPQATAPTDTATPKGRAVNPPGY